MTSALLAQSRNGVFIDNPGDGVMSQRFGGGALNYRHIVFLKMSLIDSRRHCMILSNNERDDRCT